MAEESKVRNHEDSAVEESNKKAKTEVAKPVPINFPKWLQENLKFLKPPVCNKLMYGGQLKIMFIGGGSANERSDFHIEEGEELFYQIKGDMLLRVIEKGKVKDIHIHEGELFLLPPRIPHSPIRKADTIGLVVERDRKEDEMDGLRWYVPGTTDVLYEVFFHCFDLGTQLGPEIRKFQASEACRTKKPNLEDGTVLDKIPVQLDVTTELPPPLVLAKWLEKESKALEKGVTDMFRGDDFRIAFCRAGLHKSEEKSESYVYQMQGTSELKIGGESLTLQSGDMHVVPPAVAYTVVMEDKNALQMVLTWPTC